MSSTSNAKVYKTLAAIFGVVMILVGVGALIGGNFAGSYIEEQMDKQNITLPTEEALAAQVEQGRISQELADEMRPHAGEKVTTGDGARLQAMLIGQHMDASAKAAGLEGQNYASLGAIETQHTTALEDNLRAANPTAPEEQIKKMAQAEIANPLTTDPEAQAAANAHAVRYDIMLNGSTLQGMLLNVYGWGLIGTIALWVGWGAIIVGVLLLIGSFVIKDKRAHAA